VRPEREDDARRHHNGPVARDYKKHVGNQNVNEQMWWNKKLPDLAPMNHPIPYVSLRNFRGQAPTWEFL
jgi:hypothetical protein